MISTSYEEEEEEESKKAPTSNDLLIQLSSEACVRWCCGGHLKKWMPIIIIPVET
jgi:hypothetical protein